MIADPVFLAGSSPPGALPPEFRPIGAGPVPPVADTVLAYAVPDAAVIEAADDLKRLSVANEEVWGREPIDCAADNPVHVAWEQEATATSDALTGAIKRLTDMSVATSYGAAAIADAVPSLSAFVATCDGWPEMALLLKLAGDVVRIGREAPAGADDGILVLLQDYWRCRTIELKAGEEADRLRPLYRAARPVPPPEIRIDAIQSYAKLTPSFFTNDETPAGAHLTRQGADWLRTHPRTREVMVTWVDKRHTFERVVDQTAETKVQAMLAIYEQWAGECLAVAERTGSRAADLAYEHANDEACEAAIRICDARPATLLGFAATASIIVDRDWDSDAVDLAEKLAPLACHLRPVDISAKTIEPDLGPVLVREVA